MSQTDPTGCDVAGFYCLLLAALHTLSYDRKTSLYFSKDNRADGPAYQQDNKLTEAVVQRPETVLLLLGRHNKSSVLMLT